MREKECFPVGDFALLGPNSAGKSETARALHRSDKNILTISVGSLYRFLADNLGDPENYKEIFNVLSYLEFIENDGLIVPANNCQDDHKHTLHNGDGAQKVSSQPKINKLVLERVSKEATELSNKGLIVGFDGRSPVSYGLNVFMTGPLNPVRVGIRYAEYDEAKNLSYEDNAKAIQKRDLDDFRREEGPLRIPQNCILFQRRSSTEDDTVCAEFILNKILDYRKGSYTPKGIERYILDKNSDKVIFDRRLYEAYPRE
jgi:cytidylate kinase